MHSCIRVKIVLKSTSEKLHSQYILVLRVSYGGGGGGGGNLGFPLPKYFKVNTLIKAGINCGYLI